MHRVSTIQNINLAEEDAVAGTNRIRLLRAEETRNDGRWADKMRNLVQAHEYLCHIGEAIEWIENFLNEKIDDHNTKEASIMELEKTIHDGVVLAKLARRINPSIIPNIISGDEKLKFLRSNNINAFLDAVKEVGLPSIFLFEFVDIYDGKNMPKVIYCIHALSHLLHSNSYAPKIKNLKDEFNFSNEVLVATQRNLEKSGASMPNFKNLSSSLQKELNGNKKQIYSFKPIEEPTVIDDKVPIPATLELTKEAHNPEELFVENLYESDSESRSSLDDENDMTTFRPMEILEFLDARNDSSVSLSDSGMEYTGSEALALDSDEDEDDSSSHNNTSNAFYGNWDNDHDQVGLQGYAHAYMYNNNLQNVKEQQRYHAFQSTVQNMQSRIFTGYMDSQFGEKRREYFRDSEDFITHLQAMCRRHLAIKNKQYRIEQSNILAGQVGVEGTYSAEYHERAYQKLKSEKNPSIGVVKSVLHMFNNNDVDFNEDLIIEELRQKVVESIRNNNLLDAHVSMMDIQIALCLKNAMTSDEVVKFNNTFFNLNRKKQQQQRFSELLSSNSSTNPYDLRGVDKAHREKLELYQQLVYLLQTEPHYLARLMSITGAQVYGEKKGQRRIDDTVLALFGYGTNSREECLLINLCKACISQEMKRVSSPQEFMRGNYTFMKLVVQVNRGARERAFFTRLFQDLIDKVLSDSSLDLETNPIVIYRKCIQNEETATGQPTKRAPEVSLDQALREPDVIRILSDHMDNLMRLTGEFLSAIIKTVDTMPYGMRAIARELRLVMEYTFPEEDPENIIKILGNFIFYRYLSPVITAPEQYISINHGISPLQRNNLAEISKTLQYISNGKCLTNIPSTRALNEYIMSVSPRFIQWFLDLTDVEEPEEHFGLGELSDYTNTQKPTVYVHPIDLYHMHHLLEENVDAIERKPSGILHSILSDLGEAPVVPNNNTALHLLRLELSDRRDNVLPEMEGDVKKLLLDAKRLIILVIQVQSGPTLEAILKAPVTEQDEETWCVVREKAFPSEGTEKEIEMALREREFKFGYKAAAMDVKSLSFKELKSFAYGLHNHLMKHGIIPESPGYQSIINMIAVDITKKGERRKLRNAEIQKLQHILANLEEKHEFLLGQYTAFKKYWDSSIENMAKKRGEKKRFVLPFTRQYFHMKNLQKRGLVPKYSSFKYSAKDLYERGIIVDLVGVDKKFYSKIMITLSMDCPGVIAFEANFPMTSTHLHVDVQYEDLLNAQYEGVSKKEVLEGMAVVNVNLLLYLINKKFYLTA